LKEHQTILEVLSGQTAAFDKIISAYKTHVFRIVANMVRSAEVEEVVHDVFVNAFKGLPSYRFKAPFEHWLARVAVTTCHDHWRQQKRLRVFPASPEQLQALEIEAAKLDYTEQQAMDRAKRLLDWAFDGLAPQDRLVVSLLYLEDRTMREVSEMLGWSLMKVKMRSFRARRALRRRLAERRGV